MIPTIGSMLNTSDDVSLGGEYEIGLSGGDDASCQDFVFDMKPRWQTAFLDSLNSSSQFDMSNSSLHDDNKSTASSRGKAVSAKSSEFVRKKISKARSFQDPDRPPRGNLTRSNRGAASLRSSSFQGNEFRRRRLNRGDSKLRKMQLPPSVPTTIVASVETKQTES